MGSVLALIYKLISCPFYIQDERENAESNLPFWCYWKRELNAVLKYVMVLNPRSDREQVVWGWWLSKHSAASRRAFLLFILSFYWNEVNILWILTKSLGHFSWSSFSFQIVPLFLMYWAIYCEVCTEIRNLFIRDAVQIHGLLALRKLLSIWGSPGRLKEGLLPPVCRWTPS